MGFEGYDSWKAYDARQAKLDGEQEDRDVWPLYRLVFSYRGNTINGFVRARFERDGVLVCSGSGDEEVDAVRALRDNLRDLRDRRRQHRPMGAWQYTFEAEVES